MLFAILYIIIIFTSLAILRGNSHKIINNNSSFKVNNLVLYTKSITNKFPALLSFRFTFMMNSLGRFIILLFSVITIISLISIIGGTANLFNNAIYPTIENKNYLVAYDLYSPTINSGYYSAIPYDQLGTSQQGDYNTYSVLNNTYERPLNANSDYYNGVFYDSALSYPYENNL
ncbi:hypothetical protein IKE96_04030 [bacterium]|nr:hypothetical protein [bacterium]MBR2858325.1 hypothetical protein [bacterium]